MITAQGRIAALRRDVAQLAAARETLEEGPAARSLDLLVESKRRSLAKLERVAEDLERMTQARAETSITRKDATQ